MSLADFASAVEQYTRDARTVGWVVLTVDRDGDPDIDEHLLHASREAAEVAADEARAWTRLHRRPERHAVARVVAEERAR